MSKLEQFILISLGFLIFEVIFIRIGFFFGSPIGSCTLLLSFVMYCAALTYLYSSSIFQIKQKIKSYIPIFLFIIVSLLLSGVSILLSNTYDTSWDGQGYHQSAVIALASNWNPIKEPLIHFKQNLPSQIYAESYPSALWEIEATIYSLTHRINSAKIMNIVIAIIAGMIFYSLLRKLKFGKILSYVISFFIVLQPMYLIQLLTFMEDGFGYELLLIATASFAITIVAPKSYWAIATFIMAELLLVTTKYSNLPVALVLGSLFALFIINCFLNKEYVLSRYTKYFLIGSILVASIFAYLPYGRNQIAHGALFYPANTPALMGNVIFNSVPTNLLEHNKLTLLFYGIFSKSQTEESGDPRNKSNLAELKIPFTFSLSELNDSAKLYNNRVGAGGPLFSGIIVLSVLLVFFLYFKTENFKERYAIYTSVFGLILILILSLFTPAPNLLRYVNELQLIPFVIIIPIYVVFKKTYTQIFCHMLIMLVGLNIFLFSIAVFNKTLLETKEINKQFQDMRNSRIEYQVNAQQFYSSYYILEEQNISYYAVDNFRCHNTKQLLASSTTTQLCDK
ncbi:MAG: hypothetical protein ACREHC_00555 [Candidatus Levyibacteriota bacterium]